MFDYRTFERHFMLKLIDAICIYLDNLQILLYCNWGGRGVKLGFAPPPTNFNSKTIFQFKFDFKFGKNFRDEKLGMKLTKK